MSSPLKRIRTEQPEEPAAIPASVTSVLKQLLDRDDVTNVDFRDYALIVQGSFGTGTTVYDFGGQMWLAGGGGEGVGKRCEMGVLCP